VDSDPALAIGAGPEVPVAAGELAGLAAGLAVAGELLDGALGAVLGPGDAPLAVADGSGVACARTIEESASTLATIRSRPPVAPVSRGAGAAEVSATSSAAWRGATVAAAAAASIARALP
jgi:hypothetical protein